MKTERTVTVNRRSAYLARCAYCKMNFSNDRRLPRLTVPRNIFNDEIGMDRPVFRLLWSMCEL
jgi:hypothetical protein